MISERAKTVSTLSLELDKLESELKDVTRLIESASQHKSRLETSVATLRIIMREVIAHEHLS